MSESKSFARKSFGAGSVGATDPTKKASGPRQPAILVVDDETGVRTLLEVGLRHHGLDVRVAADGPQAVTIYSQFWREIDVVLLDVRMPEMDGPRTLASLRQINPDVCCCYMSGEIGGYTHEQLIDSGAIHFVRKPFQLADVAATLREIISSSPLR